MRQLPGLLRSDPTPLGSFNATMAPNDWRYGGRAGGSFATGSGAGVTAYSAWNMVLDTVGVGIDSAARLAAGRAPDRGHVREDADRHAGLLRLPALSRSSSRRAPRSSATTGGDALAFKNPDGSLVAVMYNSGSATTYTIALAGKKLQFAMPAQGWATVYMPAS